MKVKKKSHSAKKISLSWLKPLQTLLADFKSWWWTGRPWWWRSLLGVTAGIFLFILVSIGWFISDLPSVKSFKNQDNFAVSTKILDRNGILLYEIFADTNRTPISSADLPPYVEQATISIEDKNFYHHFGLDFVGITRAIINNLRGQSLQGGSTITQQLVKVSLLSRERTLERKIKEAILTLMTEARYSKAEILNLYLNYVPYGGTAWGIEAASQTFFNKSASDLSLAEAAFLAGLPQSPSRYSPYGNNPELGQQRQKEVLRRMLEEGYITEQQQTEALQQELHFAPPNIEIKAPHFVMYVKDQLIEQYGQAIVERGGLRVKTTLDYNLQQTVQASVSAEIDSLERLRVSNGAALVTRPSTGEVLAMVGSRDYFHATAEGQINMTIRPRQPGSSMKPLNLATALELRKVTPGTVLLDIPTCFENIGQEDYCPRNYDGSYHGPVDMRTALANSYNIPAVKVTALNGINNLIATASAMGISTFRQPRDYGISLGLGAAEVTMVDMATAFGTMANQGVKVPPISILEVKDYSGEVIMAHDPTDHQEKLAKELFLSPGGDAWNRPLPSPDSSNDPNNIARVLDREVAWLMSDILRDNQARTPAFGSRSELFIPGFEVAAKTGTTNDLRDNWTIGFTPDYVAVVWVGNNDNTPMNPYLVSGVTGAAPIWNDVMSFVLKNYSSWSETPSLSSWPEKPELIVEAPYCVRSGALPNPEGPECETKTDYFWKGTEPQATENVWNGTWIAEQTGLPPRQDDPTDKLKFEEHILLTDPFTRDYCLDCQRQMIDTVDDEGNPVQEPVEEKYFATAEDLFNAQQGWWMREVEEDEVGD